MKLTSKLFKRMLKILCISICIQLCYCNFIYADSQDDDEIINIEEIEKEETISTTAGVTDEPKLNARIGLVYDRNSKTILYEKNGLKQFQMASTTKIMTSIIVLENANLNDVVTITKKAAGTGGSRLGLKTNDKITVHDLLYGLMLRSGNDAAVALAIHVGGSVEGFADLMNQKAAKMGLKNSHFLTPHGLDEKEHYTTAYELAYMADYALNIPKFKEIVGTKTYTITINNQSRAIGNTNELLGNLNGVYGVKTGFTNGAGRCLVTACKRDELDIITVVLGADTKKIRTQDSMKLIEYANKNYQVIDLEKIVNEQFENWKNINQNRFTIEKGTKQHVQLKMEEMKIKKMAVKKENIDNIKVEANCIFNLNSPVAENQILGSMKVQIENQTILTLNIYNNETIDKKNIFNYFLEILSLIP